MEKEKSQKAYSYIRFSTPEQQKGDSLRRQLEASEKYAKENGLELDKSLNLRDLGLSAYHAKHRTHGALGQFLKLVEQDKIAKGSILIVENLDRLSREQVLDALNQFTSIIKSGIEIVTLQDGMKYSTESISQNWTQLIISIAIMARANEESVLKSLRLKATWKQKRNNINKSKLTGRCPAWLKLSKDKTKFIIIPEAQQAIKKIFELKLQGKGGEAIAKQLNQESGTWKPAKNWRKSYIQKILNSKAVIGEFQPYKYVKDEETGKRERVPAGEAIPDYYPPIIDNDLFDKVQGQIKANGQVKGYAGGKTGKVTNLFTYIAKCGLCNSPLHFIDKGKPPKGRQYLHCDSVRRGNGCDAKAIDYNEFVELFFSNFEELNISDLLPDKDETKNVLNDLRKRLSDNKTQISQLQRKINNLTDAIADEDNKLVRNNLIDKQKLLNQEHDNLLQDNKAIEKEIEQITIESEQLHQSIDNSKEVYELLQNTDNEIEKRDIRLSLRQEIRKFVERIEIYPIKEYKPVQEVETGVQQIMHSKYIDKVRIKFKGSKKVRLLLRKTFAVNE